MKSTSYRKYSPFALSTLALALVCVPEMSLAESGSAALGKVIDKSYHTARKMGSKANINAIRAATQQESDHARTLLQQERFSFVKRYVRHNQSLAKTLIKKFFKSDGGGNKLVRETEGKPVGATPAPASARRPATTAASGVGAVGKSAGAKNVKFSAPSNLDPAVNPDGIIIDR